MSISAGPAQDSKVPSPESPPKAETSKKATKAKKPRPSRKQPEPVASRPNPFSPPKPFPGPQNPATLYRCCEYADSYHRQETVPFRPSENPPPVRYRPNGKVVLPPHVSSTFTEKSLEDRTLIDCTLNGCKLVRCELVRCKLVDCENIDEVGKDKEDIWENVQECGKDEEEKGEVSDGAVKDGVSGSDTGSEGAELSK